MSKGSRQEERIIKMNTEAIINAINNVQLHNDDQVIAYDEDDFIALCVEEAEEQFGGDDMAMAKYDSEKMELLHNIKEAQEKDEKPLIIISLFCGSDAREKYLLLNDLTMENLQDYTSPNNRSERLELLRLKEIYKNL